MRVLVTGADGFVGQSLKEILDKNGFDVVSAARKAKPGFLGVGDIDAGTDWTMALERCDVVVHLAARVHQMKDSAVDPLAKFRQVNTEGTRNLALQAKASGVVRFVYLSTVKVLGEELDRPYLEADSPAPLDAYSVSKLEAEQVLMAVAQDSEFEVVIIRPPLVYGLGVKGNFASLVCWLVKGLPLPLGSINNRRSLIGLNNLADFIALCADKNRSPMAKNQIFLISDGVDVSTSELLRKVATAHGVKARLIPVPEGWLRLMAKLLGLSAEANRLLGSLTVDITKSRKLLGWKPVMTIEQQLEEMVKNDT